MRDVPLLALRPPDAFLGLGAGCRSELGYWYGAGVYVAFWFEREGSPGACSSDDILRPRFYADTASDELAIATEPTYPEYLIANLDRQQYIDPVLLGLPPVLTPPTYCTLTPLCNALAVMFVRCEIGPPPDGPPVWPADDYPMGYWYGQRLAAVVTEPSADGVVPSVAHCRASFTDATRMAKAALNEIPLSGSGDPLWPEYDLD